MIQLASIVLFHLPSESDEIRPVNKNVQLLMDGLISFWTLGDELTMTSTGADQRASRRVEGYRPRKCVRCHVV